MSEIKIFQYADIQVNIRERDLKISFENNLKDIEEKIIQTKAEIVILVGDLFEYNEANDAERKLIYNHLGRVLALPSVREFVLQAGNHDLPKSKKEIESNKGNNAIDTFTHFVNNFEGIGAEKLLYVKERKIYQSRIYQQLEYVVYSLEDNSEIILDIDDENKKYQISLYHDILKEFVYDRKLPIQKKVMDRLMGMDNFHTPLILAGDIHENYFTEKDGKLFYYPGSTHQRNFGEGSYIKIRPKTIFTPAATKTTLLHTIDLDNKKHLLKEDIQLSTYTSYITIDLNTTNVMPAHIEDIENYLNQCEFGINFTYIKLVLSTAYLNNEIQIRKLISEISSTKGGIVSVDLNYDKVISKNTELNNLVGAEFLQRTLDAISDPENPDAENVINGVEDITESNLSEVFDNILLTKDMLISLFETQLQNNRSSLLKELNDEKILEEVFEDIRSLFAEQIEMSLNSVPNYNIELLSIETNGFMSLGSNSINLDIPGLIRILASNGVGKTALFNMIRWFIDNKVFESLKDNQKNINDLMIFNDEQPQKDDVIVRMNFKVNGTLITGTRYVVRKWKTNTTEEQKIEVGWQKHISNVQRGLKIEVKKEGSEVKTFTGDEAEVFIKRWFGEVINNITIFNQYKILSLLNLKSEELGQMVLNYIGVDYLPLLKNNLDVIKSRYNTQRPKMTKALLVDSITTSERIISNIQQTITTKQTVLSECKITEQEATQKIDTVNKQLQQLGNIPELITELNTNITKTQTSIDNFEIKQSKTIPLLNVVAPVKPDVSSFENQKLDIQKTLDSNNSEVTTINNQVNELTIALDKENTQNISKLSEYLEEQFNNLSSEVTIELDTLKTQFNNAISDISERFTTNKLTHQTHKNTLVSNLNMYVADKNEAITNIQKWENEIQNSMCNTCSRPYDEQQFIVLKKENQVRIDSANNTIVLINEKIKTTEQSIIDETNQISVIDAVLNKMSVNDYSLLESDTQHKLSTLTESITNKTNLLSNINARNIVYVVNGDQEHILYKVNERLISLKEFSTVIKLLQYDSMNNESINNLLIKKKTLLENNDVLNTQLTNIATQQDVINNKYLTELESYNTKLRDHNTEVASITEYNNSIIEHNKQLDTYKNDLIHYQKELVIKSSSLELYNELVTTYDKHKKYQTTVIEEINELTTEINTDNVKKVREENELTNYRKLLDEYLQYQKDSASYNLYKKIIEKDFRDSVFGYYRNFLNITFNLLLSEMNFKLIWHETGDLYYYKISRGKEIYRMVQSVSGMETCFLGLALLYAIHKLNTKFNISHIFIDEISGQLNSGKELTDKQKEESQNFQEQLLMLLSKFKDKKIFIVDHVIQNMYQTATYEVVKTDDGSKYELSLS